MERWDLYDENRVALGRTMVRGDAMPKDCYHLVVHVCIFNAQGQMLIQQRQPFKDGYPNLWDVTMGGSAISGETSRQAAEREVLEEIGYLIDLTGVRPSLSIMFEHGFDDFYLVRREVELSALHLQQSEVQAVRWADKQQIHRMIDEGTFIPRPHSFMDTLFELCERYGVCS